MFRQIAFAAVSFSTLAVPAAIAQEAAQTEQQVQQQAPAQEAPAPAVNQMDAAATYEAARNQLGILKYCEGQGFTGAEAVSAQEKMVGMLPEADEQAGAAAEQKGAEGTVSAGGAEIALDQAASQQGTTVEAQCQQIEAAVNQVAKQLPAG
ncbi:pore-forming ESAT-6 family protein [Paracoccus homiensis]|uniref:pore-forming ESAT-6 family protein n=1 Tax=Paracoccus homiensis TaxID=364199 RepID=UPI00398CD2A9